MSTIFADTSFYVAILNGRDLAHDRAVELSRRYRSVVTSEYVLIEVANWFAQSTRRGVLRSLMERLRSWNGVVIIESSHNLFERGIQLYLERTDKNWSLTDGTSMVILDEQQLGQVLSSDHHFEQAGYEILLK